MISNFPDAPCAEVDEDLWFAENPEDIASAKAICASCPLRFACLQGALDRKERWGVWGGVDEVELRRVQSVNEFGDYQISKAGKIHCAFCQSSENLEIIEKRRTRTTLHCTECNLTWITKKSINRNLTNL